MNKFALSSLAALLLVSSTCVMAENKIAFINRDKLLKEAPPMVKASKKLEKEFEKRAADLQKMATQLQTMQQNMEKNGVTMSETDRRNKEREFNDLNRDFQRKQREFNEDLNLRRNEELSTSFERIDKIIKQIAEADKIDLVVQEAVYVSPRIDITDKVIKALGDK
ncbi:MAG: OmpH family outer membrane protein [Rhodocyclaceae bacterium]|nr:OmpH family outer membrane protein [Rhodocyclaceae bacterium]